MKPFYLYWLVYIDRFIFIDWCILTSLSLLTGVYWPVYLHWLVYIDRCIFIDWCILTGLSLLAGVYWSVYLYWLCLCGGLITRSGESYRLWRVVVCDQETSQARRLKTARRLKNTNPKWVVAPVGKKIFFDWCILTGVFLLTQF